MISHFSHTNCTQLFPIFQIPDDVSGSKCGQQKNQALCLILPYLYKHVHVIIIDISGASVTSIPKQIAEQALIANVVK